MKNQATKILPTSASYVRSGNFSETVGKEINKALGLREDMLIFKHAPDTDWDRYIYVKFKLDELSGKFASLHVKLNGITVEESEVFYTVHPVNFDGNVEELTYGTRPEAGELIARALLGGFGGCDISGYVEKAKKEGKSEICLAIYATKYTDVELRLRNPLSEGDDIHIKCFKNPPSNSAVYELTDDSAKNAEIWAWAQKMYDEWKARYDEMLNEPELQAEMIESPAEQFTKEVYFSSSSKTFDSGKRLAKTRTLDALTDLDKYAPKKDYPIDKFGGLMDESMKQEATGFFHVKKLNGRFWVIDPLGYPCVIRALSQIGPNYQSSVYQMEQTLAKYGDLDNWGEVISKRVRELGFYASASPDVHVTKSSQPIVSQKSIGFAYMYGKKIGTANSKGGSSTFSENNTMNVFDPEFAEFADNQAKLAEQWRDDPYVLGYTTDNELPMQASMLFSYLSINPESPANHYSYACAWTWIKNLTGKENPTDEDITAEHLELFRGFVWDRYYNVVTTAMRKYDPNHMLLGTRFLTGVRNAEWVLKFAGRYLDCITINWYAAWEPQADSIHLIAKSANCPFIITEFYTKAGDSGLGNTSGAGQFVATQTDRGMFYQNYTLRLLEAKNCAGWHWFQYLDNDPRNAVMPDGRIRDVSSTDSNKGIFSSEHEEYTECTKYMAEINLNAYRLIEYFDNKYKK